MIDETSECLNGDRQQSFSAIHKKLDHKTKKSSVKIIVIQFFSGLTVQLITVSSDLFNSVVKHKRKKKITTAIFNSKKF